MRLTEDEERMLAGEYGEGYRRAIEILVKMGEFYDAERLVPISMAYLVEGPSPGKPGYATEMARGNCRPGNDVQVSLGHRAFGGGHLHRLRSA